MGVNSLPKTVTRQRRGCDLNSGPSVPESSTLTTRLSSHPRGYVCVKDHRECIKYIPIHFPFYTVSSHSFLFPSLCLIPIPTGFPLGYFHSHLISKLAQQNNIGLSYMQSVDSWDTEKQFHRKLDINRWKIKLLKTPFTVLWQSDRNFHSHPSKCCQLWWNSATGTNLREFFSLANRGHFHSRLRSIPHFPISLFVIHQYGSII